MTLKERSKYEGFPNVPLRPAISRSKRSTLMRRRLNFPSSTRQESTSEKRKYSILIKYTIYIKYNYASPLYLQQIRLF